MRGKGQEGSGGGGAGSSVLLGHVSCRHSWSDFTQSRPLYLSGRGGGRDHRQLRAEGGAAPVDLRVEGLFGFMVLGVGFRVWGLGFGLVGFTVWGLGFRD